MKNALLLSTIALAIVSPTSAQAVPFIDEQGQIRIEDATPNSQIEISTEISRRIRANSCGLMIIRKPSVVPTMPAQIQLEDPTAPANQRPITIANLPVNTIPACINNQLAAPRPDDFKTEAGQVVIVGRSSGVAYMVGFGGLYPRKVQSNACGMIRFNASQFNSNPTFVYNGQTYSVSSLEGRTPAKCINGIKYVPVP